jgi:hypothetical protein
MYPSVDTWGQCLLSPLGIGSAMTIFMDIEFVSIVEGDPPDAYTVTFDVIYSGETWCRSMVGVGSARAARLEGEKPAMIRVARDALLELLAAEPEPVSYQLRLTADGTAVLARAVPGE